MRIIRLAQFHLGLGDHPEPWDGPTGQYYVSDKEATCKYLASSRRFPPSAIEILSSILGYTISARIGGRDFCISGDYVSEINETKVVRRVKDFIVCEWYSDIFDRELRQLVVQDVNDNAFWTHMDFPIYGYRERFRLLASSEFAHLTSHIPRDSNGFPIPTPPDHESILEAKRFWKAALSR